MKTLTRTKLFCSVHTLLLLSRVTFLFATVSDSISDPFSQPLEGAVRIVLMGWTFGG